MWRPAVWRFGAVACAAVALAGCGARPGQPEAVGNRAAVADPSGSYWCAIEDSGYLYPRFPCVIARRGEHLALAKLAGSQRFRGEIDPDAVGFEFRGELYCPYGDCTQPLHGRFVRRAGELIGIFTDAALIVHMTATTDAAFGGTGYGGDGYGDPFGGRGYGGAAYGAPR